MASRGRLDPAPAQPSPPDVIAFVEALARAHVARDIAAARKDPNRANPHLRPVQ
ncbi:hypothetical protein SAMN05192583_1415 [Sphingomonas gellani]|uniref:Uncharacterized protein n=1 Tax=Sphingomonas gellani TaxID=1166340 RepID=A0A1H8C1I0_9SPHN|nr:hypothetical protein SAMN05192583_1415 [Sphingomonas gellani]